MGSRLGPSRDAQNMPPGRDRIDVLSVPICHRYCVRAADGRDQQPPSVSVPMRATALRCGGMRLYANGTAPR
jgi:hypothetical protein